MIVAQGKPIAEVARLIEGAKKILVVGCGGCVTVCLAGGEKETGLLAAELRILRQNQGQPLETVEETLPRQCDPEYVALLEKKVQDVDLILSLACGAGVQFLAEKYPDKWVVPAVDTKFVGVALEHGVWSERCGLCGDCILWKTGGVCPIIRCSKSILNGPCGGSQNGKCEISKETDCAWQLIYDRMRNLGKLDLLMQVEPPKDWTKSRDGGPRKLVREDLMI